MTVTYSKVIVPYAYNAETQTSTSEVRQEVTEYAGVTLKVDWRYTQIMSDVWEQEQYALVWDTETQKPDQVLWIKGGTVDATPEVIEAYRQYLIAREAERITAARQKEAEQVVKGATVSVVAGRYAKGLTGKVVAIITKPYGQGYYAQNEQKLAIAKDDETEEVPASNGKVYTRHKNVEWVWARNVKRLDIAQVDQEEVLKDATEVVKYKLK